MSRIKNKQLIICILLILFSAFLFGCDNKVAVEDIYFTDNEITLLIGETYTPPVVVNPSYATDTGYSIQTLNRNIVSVDGKTITAVNEGSTIIKVISHDNSLKEDAITINVRRTKTTLSAPRNLVYNADTQTFGFDSVGNAVGYTVKINGNTINLGNSLTYSLESYNSEFGFAYDNILNVSVRANAASYSQAFVTSAYSEETFIYQTGKVQQVALVGGVLTFDKLSSTDSYSIYLNDSPYLTTAYSASGYSLKTLTDNYAGAALNIKVIANADSAAYIGNINYSNTTFYNSLSSSISAVVVNVPTISMSGTTLSWNNISNAVGYELYLDGTLIDTITANYYDLTAYSGYAGLTNSLTNYHISVRPIISATIKNVVLTTKASNTILFNKLDDTILTAENNTFRWSVVNNANAYSIVLKRGIDTILNTTTTNTSLTIGNYAAGYNYSLTVQAIGTSYMSGSNIVYVLASNKSELTVQKQANAVLDINNYILSWNAVSTDSYWVEFDTDGINIVSLNISGSVGQVDLSGYIFTAGIHTINIRHLGDTANVFDSNLTSITFNQLENITSATVDDGVISVSVSGTNSTADIVYRIKGGLIDFEVSGPTYIFNTTDDSRTDYLSAGSYDISVYVKGNGNSTFSANRTGIIAADIYLSSIKVLETVSLLLNDKITTRVHFALIPDAVSYDIYRLDASGYTFVQNITNSYFDFELNSGSVSFAVVAVGDRINTFNSDYSENIVISRLDTPSLQLDNTTNVITLNDPNASGIVYGYDFKFNGASNTYAFDGSIFTGLLVGNNILVINAIAIDNISNNYYLNSDSYQLIINLIDETNTITVNNNNRLVLTPGNQAEEYDLAVQIVASLTTITLTSDGDRMVLTDGTYNLPYTYSNGTYYIDLLSSDYLPLIPMFATDFTVSVKYIKPSTGNDTVANSVYCQPKNIAILAKSVISREEQYFEFSNVAVTRTYNDYALFVNGEHYVALNSSVIVDDITQTFKVLLSYIINAIGSENIDAINTIAVITLNNGSTIAAPTVSVLSDEMYFTLAQSIILNATKSNIATNNSMIISFEVTATDYDKEYVVELFNKDEYSNKVNIIQLRFADSDAVGGYITINLDKYSLSGMIYITAHMVSTDSYVADMQTVQVFNSMLSEQLSFKKIDSVTGIYVDNGKIYWQAVDNAVGYEVYKVTGSGDEKINANLITGTNYDLSAETGNIKVKIKAISADDGKYTNAAFSDTISINKLATPVINIVSGDIVLTVSTTIATLLQDEDIDCLLYVNNGVHELYFSLDNEGIVLSGTALTIEPGIILNYGTSSIIIENLTFKFVVNYTELDIEETIYYLNSNPTAISVKGLFSPSNVQKHFTDVNETSEIIEHISWTADSRNVISSETVVYGYEVKIEVNGKIYYTSDSKLMYYDSSVVGNYASYSIGASDTSIVFPYGYDEDDDGIISSHECFVDGTYIISVRTLAKTISGSNLVNSTYSASYTVIIMDRLSLSVSDGIIYWNENDNATSYLVKIYSSSSNFTTMIAKDILSSTGFEFTNAIFDSYSGIYGVTVQAISTYDNVLNSVESEMFYVYRMPQASAVSIDDGNIIIIATEFFDGAIIDFVDTETGRVETIYFVRPLAAREALAALGIEAWDELYDQSVLQIVDNKIIVNTANNTILNLLSGRAYRVNIKLIGNHNSALAIINSKTSFNISTLTAAKLNTNLISISSGVLKYSSVSGYENIYYNFNDTTDVGGELTYWNNILIYNIQITTGTSSYTIYAVDYYSLPYLTLNSDYFLLTDMNGLYAYVRYAYQYMNETRYLYFNVFYENKIDLKSYDNLYYYPVSAIEEDGAYYYTSPQLTGYTTIALSNGGSFVIKVGLLGGHKHVQGGKDIGYLSSNYASSKTFVRYALNALSTYGGNIQLEDQRTYNADNELVDAPVYQLIINPINTTDYTYVYLYYLTEADARDVIDDPSGVYVKVEFNSMGKIYYVLEIPSIYDGLYNYEVKVKTFAGLGNGVGDAADYLLDSKEPVSYSTYRVLSTVHATITNGVLEWDMAYVTGEFGEKIYSYSYNLEIYYESEQALGGMAFAGCWINNDSAGVTIDMVNKKMTYDLREIDKLWDIFDSVVINGQTNKIFIRAARNEGQDEFVLNGKYEMDGTERKSIDVTVSSGIIDEGTDAFRVENGELRWYVNDLNNYSTMYIIISYVDANQQEVNITIQTAGIKKTVEGIYQYHYYVFNDSKYPLEGTLTTEYIDFGKDYIIKAYVVGTSGDNNAILNSNYANIITTSRIQKVDKSTIKTTDGILTWDAVSDAAYYIVTLTGSNGTYVFEVVNTQIDVCKYSDIYGQDVLAGSYTVTIRAVGTNKITAIISDNSSTITKLTAVQNIAIEGNNITWDAVAGAVGYEVIFKFAGTDGQEIVLNYIVTGAENNHIAAPESITGLYTVEVRAVGIGTSMVLNSDSSSFTSSTERPQPVSSVAFDADSYRYIWTVTDDFTVSDSLIISYNFRTYEYNSGEVILSDSTQFITASQTGSYTIDSIKYYYYTPTIVGMYTDFKVQVQRANTLYSAASQGPDLDFNIFTYGAGTVANPYRISSATQLLNISYFIAAHYEIITSIDMSQVNITARVNKYGAVISANFNGSLNGNDYVIHGLHNIQLSGVNSFALFNTVSSATIKNITIGTTEQGVNITNTFAANTDSAVKMAVLAVNANNSTISQVSVVNANIIITGSGSVRANLYLAGIVADGSNTTISGSKVDLSLAMQTRWTSGSYIGAVAGYANACIINSVNNIDTEVNFRITQTITNSTFTYVGGVVGYIEGQAARTSGVYNATAKIEAQNIYATNFGGIAGFAYLVTIDACETNGNISHSGINFNTNIGGVAGLSQSTTMKNSGTRMNVDIMISNASFEIYVGAIVGKLTTIGTYLSSITACYATYPIATTTVVNAGVISSIGVCGYILSSAYVTVTGCYQLT